MNVLLLTGPLYPRMGTNSTLLSKLFPYLEQSHNLRIVCFTNVGPRKKLPTGLCGVPVDWCIDERRDFYRRVLLPARARLADRTGFSDYLNGRLLLAHTRDLLKWEHFDIVISTCEPFFAADAASQLKGIKKILYLMDPPAAVSHGSSTPYRDRRLQKILSAQDAILTTPFIRDALAAHNFRVPDNGIVPVSFPLIEAHAEAPPGPKDEKIRLLFCGRLYRSIRSPAYLLKLLSRLDARFSVTFMGINCEKLTKWFPVQTKAELITLSQQPYETALQAMADADIMINIGNSVPVHMPSKTLEYINTGKPFVNFYKMDDCPTLYYTKRYPLCLNLSEKDSDLDAVAARFTEFCVANKGKTVDRAFIEQEYADCTPKYIAEQILYALET